MCPVLDDIFLNYYLFLLHPTPSSFIPHKSLPSPYLFATGLPPYYDTNVQRMYHKILHEPLRFPKGGNKQISEAAKELIRGLLVRKISDRTGSGPGGAEELKSSKFMKSLSWERVMTRSYEPEFRPPSQSADTDVRNFDAEFTREVLSFTFP